MTCGSGSFQTKETRLSQEDTMNTLFAELYVVAITALGAGIGTYLHLRMQKSHQIAVKTPSPFRETTRQARWAEIEVGALA